MQIMNFALPEESTAVRALQPFLSRNLPERRTPHWITGKVVSADDLLPVFTKEPGGVYRRMLKVRGLPRLNERPDFNEGMNFHTRERGILAIAGFEFDFQGRAKSERMTSVRSGHGDPVLFIAGVYDTKPGSVEPDSFYPHIVRAGFGLYHASMWEPFFLQPRDSQVWLEPWEDRTSILKSSSPGFFKLGNGLMAA